MFFLHLSIGMSVLYYQYDLGYDPVLVGNGFSWFFFILVQFYYFAWIAHKHIFDDFFNPRINKVIIKIIIIMLSRKLRRKKQTRINPGEYRDTVGHGEYF